MRATSLRKPRIFLRLSVCPILSWNFSRKSWSFSSPCWCCSSASVMFLIFSASIVFFSCQIYLVCAGPGAGHEFGPERQLVGRQAHCFLGFGHAHAFHLKQNSSGTHNRYPVVRRSFTFTHTGFSRFLGHRLVREQADPDFAATFHEAGHGNAAGLDL